MPRVKKNPHTRLLVSIDPGLTGTGWVVWDISPQETILPLGAGVTRPTWPSRVSGASVNSFVQRTMDLTMQLTAQWFSMVHRSLGAGDFVVCEYPVWQQSAGREMGWKRGDLQKLTFLVGALAERFRAATFIPVTPTTWKGQLPKSVTERRVRDMLGDGTCKALGLKTHAWDAAGIGLWALSSEKRLWENE